MKMRMSTHQNKSYPQVKKCHKDIFRGHDRPKLKIPPVSFFNIHEVLEKQDWISIYSENHTVEWHLCVV